MTRTNATISTTNRPSAAAYDSAGNTTSYGGQNYTYDPFHRITVAPGNRVWIYGPGDERLWTLRWAIPGDPFSLVEIYFLRGLDNQVRREYFELGGDQKGSWSVGKDYIYRDGQLLASYNPPIDQTLHYSLDHLGTPRLLTDENRNSISLHSYYPFGEEATNPNQNAERRKFTGHEREFMESGTTDDLDYMHARWCSPITGRFLGVDPLGGRPEDPRSWNRYAYALGNPMLLIDLDGLEVIVAPELRDAFDQALAESPSLRELYAKLDENTRFVASFLAPQKSSSSGTDEATMLIPSSSALALFALAAGLISEAHDVPARSSSALLICSDNTGICLLHNNGTWEPWWTDIRADTLSTFQQGPGGQVVALLRGHQAPGQLVVIDAGGHAILERSLIQASSLASITGWFPNGDLLLCNDGNFESLCDVTLKFDREARQIGRPDPDSGCLFPRFGADGRQGCLKQSADFSVTFVTTDSEGGWIEHPLEMSRSGPREFFIRKSGELLVFDMLRQFVFPPGKTHPSVLDRVWLSWYSRGSFYWSRCATTDNGIATEPCTLYREASATRPAHQWELPELDLMPLMVQETDTGSVMVDFHNVRDDKRARRAVVELVEDRNQGRLVWQQELPLPR